MQLKIVLMTDNLSHILPGLTASEVEVLIHDSVNQSALLKFVEFPVDKNSQLAALVRTYIESLLMPKSGLKEARHNVSAMASLSTGQMVKQAQVTLPGRNDLQIFRTVITQRDITKPSVDAANMVATMTFLPDDLSFTAIALETTNNEVTACTVRGNPEWSVLIPMARYMHGSMKEPKQLVAKHVTRMDIDENQGQMPITLILDLLWIAFHQSSQSESRYL